MPLSVCVPQEIILPRDETPKTVENFLKKRFPIGYVRKLLRKNGIRVNGRRIKTGDFVAPGDRLQLYIPFEKSPRREAAALPGRAAWSIIFENDDLLVIDKPPGIAVHEAKGILKRDTIIGALESRYRAQRVAPTLVHRLDQDTSGVLVIAKNARAAEELASSLQEAVKEYLCLVAGRLSEPEREIDAPLPGREGKPVRALTRFKIEKRFSETTLLRVWIATGRTHQIRLHLAGIGHPVVLDEQHGDFTFNKRFRGSYRLKRQFLHAARLTLEYGGRRHAWNAPLPADLQRVLKALKEDS